MASVRHFPITNDGEEVQTPVVDASSRATPTPESQTASPRPVRPRSLRSTSSHSRKTSLSSEILDDQDDPNSEESQSEESSVSSSRSSIASKAFDDYDFIKEIPECDMWEPIGDGPGKSFDFGSSGWTASMNVGHEFLQITAPDAACGLVYIRGSFANDPDAILARAQRRVGGKSTFGLKVAPNSEKEGYKLGRRGDEGLLNFRWPYIDHPLTIEGCDPGTCSKFTFIRKGVLYQVLRFVPGPIAVAGNNPTQERNPKAKADADTNIQKRHGTERGKSSAPTNRAAIWTDQAIKVRVGGRVRFGCPCQRKISQQEARHHVQTNNHALTVTDYTYKQRLEMCLFVDGEQIDMKVEHTNKWTAEVDAVFEKSITLSPSKVKLVVATFKFNDKNKDVARILLPSSRQLRRELGLSVRSKHATDRVWLRQIESLGGPDYFDTCPAAACLEQILGVSAVPVRWKRDPPIPPLTPLTPLSRISKRSANRTSGEIAPEEKEILKTSISDKPHEGQFPENVSSSVDYITIDDLTLAQKLAETDPSEIPLPISRTESTVSRITSDDPGDSSSLIGPKTRKISKEELADDDLAVEFLGVNGTAQMALSLEDAAPKPTGLALDEKRLSGNEFTADSSPSIKPFLSINTDPKFLSQSQSKRNGSRPGSASGGVLVRPISEDDDGNSVLGIALMGGCLGYQHVDMQRSLWQIRFLVKALQFHSSKSKPESPKTPSSPDSKKGKDKTAPLDNIRASLIGRIEYTLYHCLLWIVHVRLSHNYFVTPATAPFKRLKRPDCGYVLDPETEHDRTLYAPITIWYVMQNCREVVPQSFLRRIRKNLLRLQNQYQGDEELSDPNHKEKFCILLWYFYGCLDKMYQEVFYSDYDAFETYSEEAKRKTKKRVEADREDCRKSARDWQKKAERVMLASRKQQQGTYSDEHEIVDRLAFLGLELGLVSKNAFKQPLSCVYQARRRIIERIPTKELNPGTGVLAFQTTSNRMSTKAPWELACLSHHGRLLTTLWDDAEIDMEDLQLVRNDYHRFLTANFTYVGSWDLSKAAAETWWDLDATCVIAATRLDLRMKISKLEQNRKQGGTRIKSPAIDALLLSPSAMSPLQLGDTVDQQKSKLDGSDARPSEDGVLDLLKRQIAQQGQLIQGLKSESDLAFEYDWKSMEPGPVLQPNEWVHSLDDTPELFQSSQTKTVQLRQRLINYLVSSSKRELKHKATNLSKVSIADLKESVEKRTFQPEWHPHTISSEFTIEELSNISIANIEVWYDGLIRYELRGRLLVRQSVDDKKNRKTFDLPFYDPEDDFNSSGPDADELALDLWIAYLDGSLRSDHNLSEQFYDELKTKFSNLSLEEKDVLQDENIRALMQDEYRNSLLDCLNDSMVDCSARCRIYFIKRCTPAIVKASIYIWHTLSIDTYDDHFGDTSNFFNSNKEVWITSITISYWSLKRTSEGKSSIFNEGRDDAPFPPRKVIPRHKAKERWWKTVSREKIFTKRIEERSSSLVITGDLTGHWWMMSVITSVLPDTVMAKAIKACSNGMKEFIHQPATSRCLTFLYFLGLICEYTSENYEEILKELTVVIKLGREVLKRGLEKTQAEDSIMRLKSMLWALEALRILDDRLSESLDKIDDAKVKLLKYISNGPGRRQEHLDRLCQGLIEDFGKRYDRLASVHSKIEQKIVQITRYREGITAVSNLEDTHTALTQNETVRILTYITIAYLPISYIAAVFSMDIVTSANWSAKIFAIMTAVFLLSTLVLARSLGGLIGLWEELGLLARGWKGRSRFFGGGAANESDDEDDDTEDEDDEEVEEAENDPSSNRERLGGDGKTRISSDSKRDTANPQGDEEKGNNNSLWPLDYPRRRKTFNSQTQKGNGENEKTASVKSGGSARSVRSIATEDHPRSSRQGSMRVETTRPSSRKSIDAKAQVAAL